jgi:4-amino-4-deoxy-L-arabinose transferase-like glycosyltransferase
VTGVSRFGRADLESAGLGIGVFVLYAIGACRTIYVGDSGELVAAVHTLGIPHPSGYPLYVLLGKLWTLLVPFGSIAFRMSLFSAACAAAAVALLHRLGLRLGLHRVAAATAALLLAVSPSFWGEANIQRVYTLNALFVVLAATATFSWGASRRHRYLLVAAFLCGLGATNHTFMALMAVSIGLFAVLTEPSLARRPRLILGGAGCFIAGLLPYLYLPIRSRMNPRLDWGNPETLAAFRDVVTRRDFWGRAWIEGPSDLLVVLADYMWSLAAELVWVGAVLMLVGIVTGRRRWPISLPLLIMGVNLVAVALHGSRSDIFIWHRYYIPSYAMAALLAGMGVHWLIERTPRAGLLPLALPLLGLVLNFREFDRSRYRIAEDFSQKLLETIPPGAHLSASDDNILFVLIYLHLVEGVRPDLDLVLQGVGSANLPPLRFNPDNEALFFTHHPNWRVTALDIVPVGLVFRVARAGGPPPPIVLPREGLAGEDDPRVPQDYLTQNLVGHFHYMLGSTLERVDWSRASAEFAEAVRRAPGNDVLFYNLGLIYSGNGLFEEALAFFERSNEINPRHIASISRVRPADKVREMRLEVERMKPIEARLGEGIGVSAGPEYHRQMAIRLAAAGEELAANGHRLRALTARTASGRTSN